jgi:hypothetical protein
LWWNVPSKHFSIVTTTIIKRKEKILIDFFNFIIFRQGSAGKESRKIYFFEKSHDFHEKVLVVQNMATERNFFLNFHCIFTKKILISPKFDVLFYFLKNFRTTHSPHIHSLRHWKNGGC